MRRVAVGLLVMVVALVSLGAVAAASQKPIWVEQVGVQSQKPIWVEN